MHVDQAAVPGSGRSGAGEFHGVPEQDLVGGQDGDVEEVFEGGDGADCA